MASPSALQTLDHASAALSDAQILLSYAVQQAYPLGAQVIARSGHRSFKVRIVGYGASWSNPGDVIGAHLVTGTPRRFHYPAILGMALPPHVGA